MRTWSLPFAWCAVVLLLVATSSPVSASPPRWGDITGPVTATSLGVRMPTTPSELATMTPADETAIRRAVLARLPEVEALIAAGVVHSNGGTSGALSARASSGRYAALLKAPAIDARCGIWWTDYPGSGTWLRGGGWTRTDSAASNNVHGNFYKDGAYLDDFAYYGASTNAEAYTTWFWRAWWEPAHNYFTEAWHTVWQDGIYYLGPDAYCSYGVAK